MCGGGGGGTIPMPGVSTTRLKVIEGVGYDSHARHVHHETENWLPGYPVFCLGVDGSIGVGGGVYLHAQVHMRFRHAHHEV